MYFNKKGILKLEEINIQYISGSKVIQIPDNLKIDDDKVYLKKVGNILYIIPFHNPWQNVVNSVNIFSEGFMDSRQEPKHQSRESLD